MKNKHIWFSFFLFWFFGLLSGMLIMIKIPSEKIKNIAEIQLIEYKKAEVICGKNNVIEGEVFKTAGDRFDNGRMVPSNKFECEDMEFAAMSEASRSAIRADILQQRINDYCEYEYDYPDVNYKFGL